MKSNPDFLVFTAVADAYGHACEFLKLARPEDRLALEQALKFEKYVTHPRFGSRAGCYTDDTEMSVANTKVLLRVGHPWHDVITQEMWAQAYVEEFNYGGRRKGYSRGFQSVLESAKDGEDLLHKLKRDSKKNGGAMRSVPFGVIKKSEDAIDLAASSADTTHNTYEGRFGATAVAGMSHYAFHSGETDFSKLTEYLQDVCYYSFADYDYILHGRWDLGPVVGCQEIGITPATVWAVIDLLTEPGASLMGMLEKAIRWGGDVDSVASIAWGIGSTLLPHDDVPDFMFYNLEYWSPKTGVERLRSLGTQLMEKFG